MRGNQPRIPGSNNNDYLKIKLAHSLGVSFPTLCFRITLKPFMIELSPAFCCAFSPALLNAAVAVLTRSRDNSADKL